MAACLLAVMAWAALASASDADDARCTDMTGFVPAGAKIESAQTIKGTFVPEKGNPIQNLPPLCRIRGQAMAAPRSNIHFEIWLPLAGWNGRIHMIGNGGYSSTFSQDSLAELVRKGNVAVATDTGHTGDDLTFGFGNADAIEDWGNRAVHLSIVAAKAVTAKFYGAPARYAYFQGCSTGGHQGLMEAQRYPSDFNGILAGDPGNNRTNLNFGFLWQFLANHDPGDNQHPILSPDDLKLVNRAAVKQCDALDGVADGVIGDPRQCRFNPASLLCAAGQTAECLSDKQVKAVSRMYAGATRSDTGETVYPGWTVGSEWLEGAGGWNVYWANPRKPDEPQRVDYFRHWVFADPSWDWWKFDWSKGVDTARQKMAAVDAVNPDLSAFERGGGKLVVYQGWADPVVSAKDTIAYFEGMTNKTAQAQNFSRLFIVPGMAHCSGGPGATEFSAGTDSEHDIGLALQRWVETGVPPERIIAVKSKGKTAETGIAMSRPLCAWPKLATYKGAGDTSDSANFVCR